MQTMTVEELVAAISRGCNLKVARLGSQRRALILSGLGTQKIELDLRSYEELMLGLVRRLAERHTQGYLVEAKIGFYGDQWVQVATSSPLRRSARLMISPRHVGLLMDEIDELQRAQAA